MPLTRFPSEMSVAADRTTGVSVWQLTDHLAHSYHLYFTNDGWWDDGRRLLFGSDRGNASNLYSIELDGGEITRLTDNQPGSSRQGYQGACINPVRDEAYFWRDRQLRAIELRSGEQRVLLEAPAGWNGSSENCTADGKYVCTQLMQQVDVGPLNLGAGYIGFGALFEAHPLCRILRVPTAGGAAELLVEQRNWLGHVNTSPTRANLMTFCYEGPWTRVGQRIWGLDMDTGKVWKIRPQEPGEACGHEYWMQDGEHVGYHGKTAAGDAFFGFVRHDDTGGREVPFPLDSNHFHSNTPDLIVADGPAQGLTPHVLLAGYDGERFDGPRVLCTHRGSRHTQHLHVHPRFNHEGTKVLYTADPNGYGQLFLADVPAFESLPQRSDVIGKK
ncbi:MAG TPA: oligogalacturonate lyase family protein [Tepidisphaeraceae bacterium]|jgi:oligogalacturonide lyase